MSEPHDVVKLLLARMESHPEEFSADSGRWAEWLDQLIPFITEEERVLLREPMMQTYHEQVLDELMNGPDKRRKEREEHEYERNLKKSFALTQHQMARQAGQSLQDAYASQLSQYAQANALSAGELSASLGQANQAAGSLSETINRLKQALGAKK